jgi:elongation factor Ts
MSIPLHSHVIAAIRHLSEVSGAGLIDSRKAFEEAEQDIDKALEILRRKGYAIARKSPSR